jgi:predicted phosphodiesterase
MNQFSKFKAVFLMLIMLFLVNINLVSNIKSIQVSVEKINSPIIFDYYANSPTEYFNETKHPRYSLVAKPIDLIITPNKGRPTIVEFDRNFTVTINSSYSPDDWELRLINQENEVELKILDYYDSTEGWDLSVEPLSNIAGLYDIQFNGSSSESDYQTHSVKIVEQKEYPYKFIHLSDSHFPCYGELNTTDTVLKYIEEIKTLDLDFAIFTGDLIEGGPAWLFVNPEDDMPLAAEIQLRLGLWVLDLLDLPVYIVGGNHDLDNSAILPDNPRKVWEEYLGVNPVIYFYYLDWLYVGYSVTENGLSLNQYTFVQEVIRSADMNNIPSVMFYHSNYASQASDIRKLHDIEVMLYGHEHDERLYTKDHTLYHCEAPMYENSSSIFTVLNETCVSLDDMNYDFSILLQEPEETQFSTSSSLMTAIMCFWYIFQRRKRKSF